MFDHIILRLSSWTEWCPSEGYWTFTKKDWELKLDWYTGEAKFTRLKLNKK